MHMECPFLFPIYACIGKESERFYHKMLITVFFHLGSGIMSNFYFFFLLVFSIINVYNCIIKKQ